MSTRGMRALLAGAEFVIAQGQTLEMYAITWLGGAMFLAALIAGVALLTSGRCPECRAKNPNNHRADCPFWGM